jgi:hypothetical protein
VLLPLRKAEDRLKPGLRATSRVVEGQLGVVADPGQAGADPSRSIAEGYLAWAIEQAGGLDYRYEGAGEGHGPDPGHEADFRPEPVEPPVRARGWLVHGLLRRVFIGT